MNIIAIDKLYEYNYSIDVINALKQFWDNTNTFSSIGNPKRTNILVYFDGLCGKYTLKDGTILIAEKGSLVYTPEGSEYILELFNFENNCANTVGINFFLLDVNNEKFILDDKPIIFRDFDVSVLIRKIDMASESLLPCPAIMKAGLYDILALLSKSNKNLQQKFSPIKKGIEYLENDPNQTLSIKEIADKCNVSEIYFRKLFKEYSGKSPIEFKMNAKIEKAKKHLTYGDLNVNEISDILGFTDSAYFCKQFKMHTGFSPLEYRNKTK